MKKMLGFTMAAAMIGVGAFSFVDTAPVSDGEQIVLYANPSANAPAIQAR